MSKNNRWDKLDEEVKAALVELFGYKPFGCSVWHKALCAHFGRRYPTPHLAQSFSRLRKEGFIEVVDGHKGNTVYQVVRVETGVPGWDEVLRGGLPRGSFSTVYAQPASDTANLWALLTWAKANPEAARKRLHSLLRALGIDNIKVNIDLTDGSAVKSVWPDIEALFDNLDGEV